MSDKKIGIFIIAYQAVRTLITAYERIPQSIKDVAEEIYVIDDCSNDNQPAGHQEIALDYLDNCPETQEEVTCSKQMRCPSPFSSSHVRLR